MTPEWDSLPADAQEFRDRLAVMGLADKADQLVGFALPSAQFEPDESGDPSVRRVQARWRPGPSD